MFQLYTLLIPIVDEHKKGLDAYEYRDFIDAYLLEIEKNKQDKNSFYTGRSECVVDPS